MKKQYLGILSIALLFTLAGCNTVNNNNSSGTNTDIDTHTHTFDTEWKFDDTYHWHESTCGHDVKDSYEEHSFVNGVCSTCGLNQNLSINKAYYVSKFTAELADGSYLIKSYDYDADTRTIETTTNALIGTMELISQSTKDIYNEKNLVTYSYESKYDSIVEKYYEYNDDNLPSKIDYYYDGEFEHYKTYEYDELKRIKKVTDTTPDYGGNIGEDNVTNTYYYYFDGYYLEDYVSLGSHIVYKYAETVDEINKTKTVTQYRINGEESELEYSVTYNLNTGLIVKMEGSFEGETLLNANNDPTHIEYIGVGNTILYTLADFSYKEDGTIDKVSFTQNNSNDGLDTYNLYITEDENANVVKEEIYLLDEGEIVTSYMTVEYEIEELPVDAFIPTQLFAPARKGNYINLMFGAFKIPESLLSESSGIF